MTVPEIKTVSPCAASSVAKDRFEKPTHSETERINPRITSIRLFIKTLP
jgi:hypothetical protein